ncbi:farnesyl-diphosphate synthase, partial [Candidatus Peregrinibacteria bacterium CG_4_9_14_3_um_filter_49_12]
IDAALEAYMRSFGDSCPSALQEAMRYSLLAPGKRIRPLLAMAAAEACGGSAMQALPAACAVEMVHAYSLIHDDLPCMDDDAMRRGRPSCHIAFGEAEALLAGDALLALAFDVLAKDVQPADSATACIRTLATASGPTGMVGGQSDDLRGVKGGSGTEYLESIDRRKTGALLEAALLCGGIIAAGTSEQLAALEQYGWRIGLAFQIRDDLLDTQSTPETLGKATGKDAALSKLTYPSLLGEQAGAKRMHDLVHEASDAIALFRDSANPLRALAKFTVERQS